MAKRITKEPLGGNAVIYARYSSHNQRDVSIEQQYAACEKFAAEKGYTVIEHYADRAISGRTDNRPSFQRMMKDAHGGSFDFVISWKSNRMGRNMMQAMVNEAKLADLGIRCLYVEEDFDDTAAGRFSLRTMMNVNQFYTENLAEDVRRGMMDNARKCKVNNKPPLGYRRGADGRYEIYEPDAAIVREIFCRLLDGWSIMDLMTDLNRRGIKTSRGNEWSVQSFQHILSKPNILDLRQRHHRPDKQKPLESSISAGSRGFFFLRWLSRQRQSGRPCGGWTYTALTIEPCNDRTAIVKVVEGYR